MYVGIIHMSSYLFVYLMNMEKNKIVGTKLSIRVTSYVNRAAYYVVGGLHDPFLVCLFVCLFFCLLFVFCLFDLKKNVCAACCLTGVAMGMLHLVKLRGNLSVVRWRGMSCISHGRGGSTFCYIKLYSTTILSRCSISSLYCFFFFRIDCLIESSLVTVKSTRSTFSGVPGSCLRVFAFLPL